MTESSTDEVCYLCSTSTVPRVNVFSDEGKRWELLSKIQSCLNTTLPEVESLSYLVCVHCICKLEFFLEFKQACQQSGSVLKGSNESLESERHVIKKGFRQYKHVKRRKARWYLRKKYRSLVNCAKRNYMRHRFPNKKAVVIPRIPPAKRFANRLARDQAKALNPATDTPFVSKADACNRLLRYHVFYEEKLSQEEIENEDTLFQEGAECILNNCQLLMNRYQNVLLNESMQEIRTSELIMLDRLLVTQEKEELDRLRKAEEELERLRKAAERVCCGSNSSVSEVKETIVKPPEIKQEPISPPPSPPSLMEARVVVQDVMDDNAIKKDLEENNFTVVKVETENVVKKNDEELYKEWEAIQKELNKYSMVGENADDSSEETKGGDMLLGLDRSLDEVMAVDFDIPEVSASSSQPKEPTLNENSIVPSTIQQPTDTDIDPFVWLKSGPNSPVSEPVLLPEIPTNSCANVNGELPLPMPNYGVELSSCSMYHSSQFMPNSTVVDNSYNFNTYAHDSIPNGYSDGSDVNSVVQNTIENILTLQQTDNSLNTSFTNFWPNTGYANMPMNGDTRNSPSMWPDTEYSGMAVNGNPHHSDFHEAFYTESQNGSVNFYDDKEWMLDSALDEAAKRMLTS